jgi:hypothetical protein
LPLPLPDLDDRTYANLVAEARSRLPAYCPDWTDHNASDPGIMLVELFAWLAEMLLYRTNRVPTRHVVAFLTLLNGAAWKPGPDIAEDIRDSILGLRMTWRAVTAEDYEALALAEAAPGRVARTHCLPRRDLSVPGEAGKRAERPGHVSVILVPPGAGGETAPMPDATLCEVVRLFLDDRRLLTTRNHVVGPEYVPVQVRVTVVRRDPLTEPEKALLPQTVANAVAAFLHPLSGGVAGKGWPFGGAIQILEEMLAVVPANGPAAERRAVATE